MTPQELEQFRLKAQIEALRLLVRGLYTGIANSSPSAAKSLRERFAELRKQSGQVALKQIAPAYSDMLAAENQAALEDLLSFIEDGIKP